MKRNSITPTDLFLALLALLLISVSFYQTWLGLEQVFGKASILISFVLSSLLLFLNYLLRNLKVADKPTSGLMWLYVFVALFCFVANFNALYTRFMRTDIYTNELRTIDSSFDKLDKEVAAKFNYKYPPEVAQNVEAKKKQLIEQIQDPGNPGIGERAKSLISDIQKLLGEKIDILEPVSNDYVELANRMGKQVDALILNLSPQEADLKNELAKIVLKYNKKIQEMLLKPKEEIDNSAQALIEESVNELNKIGSKASSVLGESKFKYTPIAPQTQEIGKIGYAFSHAIDNFGIYQIVVLLGCLILDFLIPILILLIVKSDDIKPGFNSGNQKRGGVLTPKS